MNYFQDWWERTKDMIIKRLPLREPAAFDALAEIAFEAGVAEGREIGYSDGYNVGYEAGRYGEGKDYLQ